MEVVGLTLVGGMTHVEDWDEGRMMEVANWLKRREADLATAWVEAWGREKPPDRTPVGLVLLDLALGALSFDLLAVHIRVEDARSSSCMGLRIGRLSCQPLAPTPTSQGAIPRRIEGVEVKLYVNPTLPGQQPPQAQARPATSHYSYVAEIGMIAIELELPDIGRVLCARGVSPGGRGRRLRISGAVFDLHGQLRPTQVQHFVFHLLHVFYGGELRAWKAWVVRKHFMACRPLTPAEHDLYIECDTQLRRIGSGTTGAYPRVRELWPWTADAIRRALAERRLQELEQVMTYADIVHTRCEGRGWKLPAASPERSRDQALLVPADHPMFQEFDALAAVVARARAHWFHDDACLREFVLERFRFETIEVSVPSWSPPCLI